MAAGIEAGESRREAELIVKHVTGLSLAEQVLRAGEPLDREPLGVIAALSGERVKRVPLQYCLGYAYFCGMKLTVRPGVFIPRVDTEILVEVACRRLSSLEAPSVADIGAGTGAVAIAILARVPDARLQALDLSEVAVSLCRENALHIGVMDRLTVSLADWRAALAYELDAIVSNPPYIPRSKKPELDPEVALYEPELALFGDDEDGLRFYRELCTLAPAHLKPDGFIAVEVGDGQTQTVIDIFCEGRWRQVEVHEDLNKLPRVISARVPLR